VNEKQLEAFVSQAFTLQDTADRAVLDVDYLLAIVMARALLLVQSLPDEGLLRKKEWNNIAPLVLNEIEPYTQELAQSITRQEIAAAPVMKEYAVKEAELAGAKITEKLGPLETAVIIQLVNQTKLGNSTFRRLFTPAKGSISPWTNGIFSVVDRKVQQGILQEVPSAEIAKSVVTRRKRNGVSGVSLQGPTAARTIRSQATTVARTVTQNIQAEIKDQLWLDNAKALDGYLFEWTALLDSKTCAYCAPLDGRTAKYRQDLPPWPAHFGCRCQVILSAREDAINIRDRLGEQLGTERFKGAGAYRTKTKVNGKEYYRRYQYVKGDRYADYLAGSNLLTQQQFFGGGPIGERRARYFRNQLERTKLGPQAILQSMIKGDGNSGRFISLP